MSDADKLQLVDIILDQPDADIDRWWADGAKSRWNAYKEGKLETVSYSQVMEKYCIVF
ncbi:addiction module protein [Desulfococcaceae bacterium HSG8]|nr:addiction module protein [Desulfococcaceae bacterium HSG8]